MTSYWLWCHYSAPLIIWHLDYLDLKLGGVLTKAGMSQLWRSFECCSDSQTLAAS